MYQSGTSLRRPTKALNRIYVPDNLILTPAVLVAAIRKMATTVIEEAIHNLIDELDGRSEDADIEVGADLEPAPEEEDIFCVRRADPFRWT